MSFLSTAFLAALPLAAAPILLHLFDRRRNVVIEWGAMQFLMEAASRRTSARKLKQWLLLLLRVCAVAALVLALSRPMLPGNWFGNTDRGETLFIIDNSMSMTRTSGETTLFDKAIERAVETLDDIEPGDTVRVLLASPYPVWAMAGSLRLDAGSRPLIEDQLRELRATQGRSDLLAALFTAAQAELEPTQHRRRIVLLTDGQSSDWSLSDENGWSRFREVLESAAVPTELEIIELDQQPSDSANVAVDRIESSRTVVGVGQPFSLTAQLKNYGRLTSLPGSARWTIDAAEVHENQIPSLNAGQGQDVIWKHSFSETGTYSMTCRLDADDELETDNAATVVIDVVDEVPVVVVESSPELAEMQQDAFFVLAALGWIAGEPLDARGVHVPTLISPGRLASFDLTDQRAVVIPNLTTLSDEDVHRLEEFVEEGGGLWIGLGPRTDIDAFNQQLFAEGNGLAPLAIDRIVDDEAEQSGTDGTRAKTSIDPFVPDHPATAELANNEQLDLGDVTVSRRFQFVPPPEEEQSQTLLSLTNGQPLAVEKYVGRGRVIVQAVPLRLQWSELARSQAFVVMVQDWLNYLTEPRATRHNLSPGDPISIHLADSQNRDATLHTPHGDEIELTADASGDGVVFRSSRTILPGNYSLELGLSGDSIPFHVNRDPEESDLSPLTAADREQLTGVTTIRQTASSAALTGGNQSEPIWPILLMVLIGLIAAELLLAGVIARERFGSDPISETSEQWAGNG